MFTEKFVLLKSSDSYTRNPFLIIADWQFWLANEDQIEKWVISFLPRGLEHIKGMTVEFDSDNQLTHFLLRWS
jgi:hypothetical protein